MRAFRLLPVLFALVTPPAVADTAGELRKNCLHILHFIDNPNDASVYSFGAGVCTGYLDATLQLGGLSNDYWRKDLQFCVNDDNVPSREQMVRVFVKYMDDNPKDWQKLSAEMAMRAFHDAWPCPAGK